MCFVEAKRVVSDYGNVRSNKSKYFVEVKRAFSERRRRPKARGPAKTEKTVQTYCTKRKNPEVLDGYIGRFASQPRLYRK